MEITQSAECLVEELETLAVICGIAPEKGDDAGLISFAFCGDAENSWRLIVSFLFP
ncbi:MAG: hypothetical protein GY731_04830 [Gammaproteobacteria bacterium]|nr:hypothetical protein [Gammaproteobacteria bacterium]